MMKTMRTLTIGMIIGGMLASGVGYASSVMTKIEVSMEPVTFTYNNRVVSHTFTNGSEQLPTSFIYKGTTYVPVRFVGEAVGKNVTWDAHARAVAITDRGTDRSAENSGGASTVSYSEITIHSAQANTSLPKEVKDWVESHYKQSYKSSKVVNGSTYILLAMGEQSSGGYSIKINGVTESNGKLTIKAEYLRPAPGDIVTMAITYPSVLLKINKAYTDVTFNITGETKAEIR